MRKSDRSQINEINVVPYVDVMLVLLVVFMVTAPLLVQGIKIDLPETSASVLDESELEELTLTIDKKGQYFIEFESYKNKSFSIDECLIIISSTVFRGIIINFQFQMLFSQLR